MNQKPSMTQKPFVNPLNQTGLFLMFRSKLIPTRKQIRANELGGWTDGKNQYGLLELGIIAAPSQ